MKHTTLHIAAGLTLLLAAGCSDDFLAEKQPYGKFSYDEVYSDMTSVRLRLNYIYQKSLPYTKGYNANGASQTDNNAGDQWPVGYPDMLSANADEFTGYGLYTDPAQTWDNTSISAYFWQGFNEAPWKKIRECNDVLYGIAMCENSSLTDEEKQQVISQARFFRASRYYRLWKRYGGLPIADTIQSTLASDSTSLRLPRATTRATFDFMISDLTYAGDHLPARWDEEVNDWGRITSGTAYSLAAIIATYYASPIFNRADDQSRWQQAYDLYDIALSKLDEGGFGLAYEGNPGTNAANWARIWTNMTMGDGARSEAVYFTMCSNATSATNDKAILNAWEQSIRPRNAGGGGNLSPSAELVDAFPMADGRRPDDLAGSYTYDPLLFFLNRDPRFYRTFAFPGVEWAFAGTPDTTVCPYRTGLEYKLHNFAFYSVEDRALDTLQTGYFDDRLGNNGQTVYVRKKSLDQSLGATRFYIYSSEDGFKINAQPQLAIRYTEVLLGKAEAACGIGRLDEAWDILVRIRQRVGYTGGCGLDPAIRSDRARMFEAILYERRIELAYEGKRFDDCHRWMLFDGGVGQEAISPTWAMTAWGGNTCAYLGVRPLNDVMRHRIEVLYDPDVYTSSTLSPEVSPMADLEDSYPDALTLDEDFTTTYDEASATTTVRNARVRSWANFYGSYMLRKDVATMTSTAEVGAAPVWNPLCYFMGLRNGDQENNPGVAQTLGWQSVFGGMGTYDPLAE